VACGGCSDCRLAGLHSRTSSSLSILLLFSLLQLAGRLEAATADDNIAAEVEAVAFDFAAVVAAAAVVVFAVDALGGVAVAAVVRGQRRDFLECCCCFHLGWDCSLTDECRESLSSLISQKVAEWSDNIHSFPVRQSSSDLNVDRLGLLVAASFG
jgi:hypothetical protein